MTKEEDELANKQKEEQARVANEKAAAANKAAAETRAKNISESVELVEKTNKAAERLEAANVKQEELLGRAEALKVADTLAGTADAGAGQTVETDADYAKKVLANEVVTDDGTEEKDK